METKKCTKCGLVLDISSFYKKSTGKVRSACKTCYCDVGKRNYIKNKEHINNRNNKNYADKKEEYSDVRKIYRRSEHGKKVMTACQARFRSGEKGRERTQKYYRKWAEKNREKRRAHWAVKDAIKRGTLTRLPCSVCGEIKAHAHHEDYQKPLDVVWLCVVHHKLLHRKDYHCESSIEELQK